VLVCTLKILINDGFRELCPENFFRDFLSKEVFEGLYPSESGFDVYACSRNDYMNVSMVLLISGMGVQYSGEP
jgi:hypothetical protein